MTDELPSAVDRPSSIPWPPIILTGVIMGAVAFQRVYPIAWPGENDAPAHIAGLGIGFAGLLLTAWAVFTLFQHNTTVLPDRPARTLVTTGPYAWRRNPIYLGEALMLLGVAELTHNIWFVILTAVFAGLILWLAILPEERHLEAKFGTEWQAYAEQTRRFL
jgi:protein-S-isoprenylcysteine O-methyltransferase Ste14